MYYKTFRIIMQIDYLIGKVVEFILVWVARIYTSIRFRTWVK